jgi:hypothetical protein
MRIFHRNTAHLRLAISEIIDPNVAAGRSDLTLNRKIRGSRADGR